MNYPSNQPQIEMVPRGSVHLNPDRPRKGNRKSRRQLANSLRRFGMKGAILVDRDTNTIVAGNGLWEAVGDLGWKDIPVIWVSFATEADRRAFILAHNKLAESSDWDAKIVEQELKFLFDKGYDYEITGFSTNDLDFSFVTTPDPNNDVFVPYASGLAVSRRGDRWQIGPHVIVCGDSLEPASYGLALGGRLADVVNTKENHPIWIKSPVVCYCPTRCFHDGIAFKPSVGIRACRDAQTPVPSGSVR